METMERIRRQFRFTAQDEANLTALQGVLLDRAPQLADDFYRYLMAEPDTARYFQTEKAVRRRKETFTAWLEDLLSATYDNALLQRLQRIGRVHQDIGLAGYHVDAAMHFLRERFRQEVAAHIRDGRAKEPLLVSLHKALDIHLSIITAAFQEEQLNRVFLSHRLESRLIRGAERLLQGLNLLLVVGLSVMAAGVVGLLVNDVIHAFTANLEHGVIKALGSLLILWMMIELLHTEIKHLKGGTLHVCIFVELALVAFIRKLFVATFEHKAPADFLLLLGALLVLGIIYFLIARGEKKER